MNIQSYLTVESAFVYCSSYLGVCVDWHNATSPAAYAAKSRHISLYSALCSVRNRAGSTIRGHICMNILSYVSVQYVLVYSCACVVVQVDLHNATVRTASYGILLSPPHKYAKTRQPCMATLGITARHKTCVIASKRIMPRLRGLCRLHLLPV